METQVVSIDFAIVAYHSRFRQAARLSQYHLNDRAYIFTDHGDLGEWENHRRTLDYMASNSTASHIVVLQDDAVPIDNFPALALEAVTAKPDRMISFYTGTWRPLGPRVEYAVKQADRAGASWLRARTLLWGVAVAIPRAHIPAILRWAANPAAPEPYDNRIGSYYEINNEFVYYTHPSLVEHWDGESLVGHTGGSRHAHRLGVPRFNELVVEI